MKLLPLILSLLITVGLIFILNNELKIGKANIPPLGNFLSPFSGFWQNTKVDDEFTNQQFDFDGLKDKVTVAFDERRVPHIFAQSMEDAYFVQGYVTARDRLWQMDISTRSSSGRLAEILGDKMLEFDKRQRRLGLLKAAEDVSAVWKSDKTALSKLEAYVNGVNRYINQLSPKDYPIEYKLLNYKPEPWSILKSAQFYKSMEQALTSREFDLENSNLLKAFGSETYEYLFPNRNPKEDPIIPKGTVWNTQNELPNLPTSDSIDLGFHEPVNGYESIERGADFIGSNNWVVAGSKTESGYPILCNDPHLQMTLPAIWYEVQINTPEVNCYGVSFTGVPGVVIGFNENIAWGTTNGGHDVKDWYKIKWVDTQKQSYLLDGKATPIETRIEEINVKGSGMVYDTVKYTHWGPVFEEGENSLYQDMAVRWISHDVENDMIWKTFWNFNSAKNHKDFIEATHYYKHPNQNFVFASKDGDIALKVSGQIPIKKENQGKFILDGSNRKNAWQGIIPSSQMPQSLNPEQGFLSSANQVSADETYPFPISGNFNHYRGRIINRKLDSMQNVTAVDMMNLQMNNESILAEELLPQLIKYLDKNELTPLQFGLLKILEDWNFSFEKDAIAPLLFEDWRLKFRDLMWDEMEALNKSNPIVYPSDWRTIEILETDPLNSFFDIQKTVEKEGPREIVTFAFLRMAESLETELGDKDYTWEDYRATDIDHMAKLPGFSRKNISTGGYKEAINAIQKTAGPSWRMVVELGEETKAWGVFPGGQSGNPASKFYDNSIEDWSNGNFYELFFMKNVNDNRQPILFKQEFK